VPQNAEYVGDLATLHEHRPATTSLVLRAGEPMGAYDLEALVDEDVVRPVDANRVDVVLAVAQRHNTVDGASRVGGQGSGLGLVRQRVGVVRAQDRRWPSTRAWSCAKSDSRPQPVQLSSVVLVTGRPRFVH
jgi:hypothetical protein